jgi:ubiquinone/menaquinone biosynthesis C-methylase UbiE
MFPMGDDQSVQEQWRQAAQYWEKHRRTIQMMFAPITRALLEAAEVRPGHRVLDVATGPGEPALEMAESVGAEGTVIGVDAAPEMVEAARREADRRGLRNVHFEEAPADRLPFSVGAFDAVVSRFGVMFFPSPVEGVREMLRVVQPRKKLALAVWSLAERNPFHHIIADVISRYVDAPTPEADAPDVFRFAAPGKLVNVLRQAGAVDASEHLLQFQIRAPVSPEEFWTLRREMSDKIRATLARLSASQVTEIRAAVIDGLREYSSDTELNCPAEVLIAGGRKA